LSQYTVIHLPASPFNYKVSTFQISIKW